MIRRLLILTTVILFVGCVRVSVPTVSNLASSPEHAKLISSSLAESINTASTIRGLWNVRVDYQQSSDRFRQTLVYQAPESLRIDLLAEQTATTLALLTSRPGSTTLLNPQEHSAELSNSPEILIQKLTRIPASVEDIVALMLGAATRSGSESDQLYCGVPVGFCALVRGDFNWYWLVDDATGRVAHVERRQPGSRRLIFSADYDAYEKIGGIWVPGIIRLSLPRDGVDVTLVRNNFVVNTKVSEKLFEVKIPESYQRREME